MAHENDLKQVIIERAKFVNGETAGEGLIDIMAEETIKKITARETFTMGDIVVKTMSVCTEKAKKHEKGVYVYRYETPFELEFQRFNTIAEAIRTAVNYFNAYVIYKGKIVRFNTLDETTAYYYDKDTIKLVNIA